MLNRQEYSFYIDGLPPGPLLYCTQEQYSSLMNPPQVSIPSLAGRYDNPIFRTGPLGWRNRFLGIDSWAPYTITNTGSADGGRVGECVGG